jgi:nitrite reductase/ring-hydroxylating ferredoxin subunit
MTNDPQQRIVPHVGTYRRELPVSLERLYENAIDWEHLPFLHRTAFARIECHEAGHWGFRARVWPQPYNEQRSVVIELRLEPELRRWITTTRDGPGTGTEVWTHAFSLAERSTLVVVDFFVPGVGQSRRGELARFYTSLYSRLYDEDLGMMSERQSRLDRFDRRPTERRASIVLGSLADVRARLPVTVHCNGRNYRIVENQGNLVAYDTLCPHMLGPLGESDVCNGIVECPWHGYRFEITTGRCVSGANLRLPAAPRVRIDETSRVILEFAPRL